MARQLKRKFKKLMRDSSPNSRDICIFTSQYLRDVHDIDLSPKEYYEKLQGKVEPIRHNFMLARAHYAEQFHFPEITSEDKPENPKEGQFFTNKNYDLEKYNTITDTWIEITEPKLPTDDEN